MGKIVVNTEQLRKQARDIQKASDDLRAVSGQLSVLINSVNQDAYEGQLTQKIREILGGVENRAGQLAGNLSGLQKELDRRAALFDEANRQTLQCIVPLTRISNFTIDQATGDVRNPPRSIEVSSLVNGGSKPVFVETDDKIKPENYSSCAVYARERRPDLGTAYRPDLGIQTQGAANYIEIHNAQKIGPTDDLTTKIAPGYALVWDRGDGNGGADKEHGHIAIVEEVHEDYVWVSHAGWGEGYRTKFTKEYLSQFLYVIP